MSTMDIFSQALSLPLSQRAELAQRLIDSLQNDQSLPAGASDEQLALRLEQISSGKYEAMDWRKALSTMRAALAETTRAN